MVTYSFHLYFRSSHHFIQNFHVVDTNEIQNTMKRNWPNGITQASIKNKKVDKLRRREELATPFHKTAPPILLKLRKRWPSPGGEEGGGGGGTPLHKLRKTGR